MTVFQAIVLGLVQGLAEMLPISSSGHLILFPWLFNFPDPGLAFDVALHVGTLVAILFYFWKDWFAIIRDVFWAIKRRKIETFEQKLAIYIVAASVPGAIAGVTLENYAETVFRTPLLIAVTLSALGLVLLYADRQDKEKRVLKDMKLSDAIKIGLAQALAIIPGVSRSGVTMTAGLFSGFKREDVAKFSFLMSAPIIAGAGLVKLPDLTMSDISSSVFIFGFLSAVLSSFFAISFLLNFVKKHRFSVFGYYRFALSLVIVILIIIRGL